MSEFASFDDAASALSAASAADHADSSGTSTEPSVTPEGSQSSVGTTPAPAQQQPPVEDSFTKTDLNSLLNGVEDPVARERIENAYKAFQGDYTRTKQQLAPYRDLMEAGVDPNRVRSSLEFMQALETDPTFVVEVHNYLSEQLQQAGYSPEQADAAAADQMGLDEEGGINYAELEKSPLGQRLNQIESWAAQQERQQYEMQLAGEIQRAEMAIRQNDPSLTDPEVDRIYELAFAYGGDLHAAHQAYQGWKNEVLSGYLSAKDATPAALNVPGATGHAEVQPESPGTIADATRSAEAYLRSLEAQS